MGWGWGGLGDSGGAQEEADEGDLLVWVGEVIGSGAWGLDRSGVAAGGRKEREGQPVVRQEEGMADRTSSGVPGRNA